MKKHKIHMLSSGIIFIFLLNLVIAGTATSNFSQTDILIVQLGTDNELDETGKIIIDAIQNRNEIEKNQLNENLVNIQNQPSYLTSIYHLNFEQIGREYQWLTIKRIQVSIEDFKDGILNQYRKTILMVIGHGTPDGLVDSTQDMEGWDEVNAILKDQKSTGTILISCFGQKALDGIGNSMGFRGKIDYQIAAYLAIAAIFKGLGDESLYNHQFFKAIVRYCQIQDNPEIARYLYFDMGDEGGGGGSYVPYLSTIERDFQIVCVIVAILSICFDFFVSSDSPFVAKILYKFLLAGSAGFIANIVNFVLGITTQQAFIGYFLTFVVDFAGWIYFAWYAISTAQRAVLIITAAMAIFLIIFDGILNVVSAGIVTAAKILIGIGSFIIIGFDLYYETHDSNDIVGY